MSDTPDLLNSIKQVSHFKHLPVKDLKRIITAGKVRRFVADTMIFREEEPSAGLFVLLKGKVHLCKTSPEGQESILAVVEPVIMFNEVPALDGGPNTVCARAVENCLVWHANSGDFHQLLLAYPTMALGLLRVMAKRNRFLVTQYEDLSFRSVLQRTAKLLLDLSEHGTQPIDRRRHPNTEMAARISTVPEAFSRALREFKERGYINSTRDTLSVNTPDRLATHAQISPLLPDSD